MDNYPPKSVIKCSLKITNDEYLACINCYVYIFKRMSFLAFCFVAYFEILIVFIKYSDFREKLPSQSGIESSIEPLVGVSSLHNRLSPYFCKEKS